MSDYTERFASLAPLFLVGGNVAWYYGTKAIYESLTPPPEEVSKSDSERVIWALARSVPPVALAAFLGFELQAFTYTQQGREPLPSLTTPNTSGVPSAFEIIERVQKQTFEQCFMTTMAAATAAYWVKDVKGVDARIAPAMSYMYCLCRPLFAAGYLNGLLLRLPGLLAGGFWMNGAVFIYALLLRAGVKDSVALRKRVFVGTPAGVILTVVALIASAGAQK